MSEIDHLSLSTNSTSIESILVRAKLAIDQICQIIKVKILRNINGTQKAKRRAWARNKSKLLRLGEGLKEIRNNLMVAIGANNSLITSTFFHSTCLTNDRSSSSKLDNNLAIIGHEIKSANDSVVRRLGEIHDIVAVTYNVVASQAYKPDIANATPARTYSYNPENPPLRSHSPQYNDIITQSHYQNYGNSQASNGEDGSEPSIDSRPPEHARLIPQPASLLERSPNFYPESYWLGKGVRPSFLIILVIFGYRV